MSMNLRKLAKKLVQNKRDKKTQKVRLDFIILSLNLSVFFIHWLVFAHPHPLYLAHHLPTNFTRFNRI